MSRQCAIPRWGEAPFTNTSAASVAEDDTQLGHAVESRGRPSSGAGKLSNVLLEDILRAQLHAPQRHRASWSALSFLRSPTSRPLLSGCARASRLAS